MDSGVRSSYLRPVGLMTMSPDAASRPLRFPLVQATRLRRGNSWCRTATSSRRACSLMARLIGPPLDYLQVLHHVVLPATEIVVQGPVLAVQRVVRYPVFLDGLVSVRAQLAHLLGRSLDVRVDACSDRGVHRAAQGRALVTADDAARSPRDIGVALDDGAGAVGGSLDERPVNSRRPCGQSSPDEEAAEFGVHQHRAIAVPPIEGKQAVLARLLPGRLRFEMVMKVYPPLTRRFVVLGWHGMLHEPGKDVSHPALAGFVAIEPGDNAAVDHPAHPRHLGEVVTQHQMTGTCSHNHDHPARLDNLRRGYAHMRVYVRHGHRDPRLQAGPAGSLLGQISRSRAER